MQPARPKIGDRFWWLPLIIVPMCAALLLGLKFFPAKYSKSAPITETPCDIILMVTGSTGHVLLFPLLCLPAVFIMRRHYKSSPLEAIPVSIMLMIALAAIAYLLVFVMPPSSPALFFFPLVGIIAFCWLVKRLFRRGEILLKGTFALLLKIAPLGLLWLLSLMVLQWLDIYLPGWTGISWLVAGGLLFLVPMMLLPPIGWVLKRLSFRALAAATCAALVIPIGAELLMNTSIVETEPFPGCHCRCACSCILSN